MQVGARAALSLQPGDTTGFHNLSGAIERTALDQRTVCPAGSAAQAMAYGLMPSHASPPRMLKLSPSAIHTARWLGSTCARISFHVALSKVLARQKKITGRPW